MSADDQKEARSKVIEQLFDSYDYLRSRPELLDEANECLDQIQRLIFEEMKDSE